MDNHNHIYFDSSVSAESLDFQPFGAPVSFLVLVTNKSSQHAQFELQLFPEGINEKEAEHLWYIKTPVSSRKMPPGAQVQFKVQIKDNPIPEDVREKISNTLKGKMVGEKNGFYGKKHSKKTLKKISGRNHYSWIGTDQWWKREILKIDKSCSLCHTGIRFEIHHKDQDRSNNKRSNLIVLCLKCHHFWHNNQ